VYKQSGVCLCTMRRVLVLLKSKANQVSRGSGQTEATRTLNPDLTGPRLPYMVATL